MPETVTQTSEGRARVSKRRGKRGPICDDSWHDAFLASLREGKIGIRPACKLLGVNPQTAYDHRATHPEFAKEWDEIMKLREAAYIAHLGQTMQQRALTGTLKPVFQGGVRVGFIREYDNRLGMWMLERLDPDKYAEKVTVENQGTVTVHHDVTISKEQVEEHAKRAFPGMFASVLPPQLADRGGVTEVEAEDISDGQPKEE